MDLYLPPKPAIIMPSREINKGVFGAPIGFVSGAKPDPVITYLGGAAFGSNGSAYATSFSLDAATADRMIVAVFQNNQLGTNYTNAYCTDICGHSPTLVASGMAFGSGVIMYRAAVPTNSSGAVSFARAGNMGYGIIQLYSIKNLTSHVPIGTAANASGSTASLTTKAGGAALVSIFCQTTDPTSSGITTNKQRTVCGGTGGGYAQNSFSLTPTPLTAYTVGELYRWCAGSWY